MGQLFSIDAFSGWRVIRALAPLAELGASAEKRILQHAKIQLGARWRCLYLV
jgi:hypothetical protein